MSATGTPTTVPFVGLRPFDTADAAWFFGRDRETAALTRKLRASRFSAVVGPSGSGKSSVVRAGVVPLLQSDGWQQIITTPGSAPLARLARAVAGAEADDRLAEARRFRFDAMLRASAFGLLEIAETLLADAPRLLLVIDQFEELFRYGDETTGTLRAAMREEARAFVELLLTATSNTAGRLQVCVTMRSDYFGACSTYVGLAEAVSASQFLIPLPQRGQLDDAIRKPVARAGAVIEEGLVQRLLVDVEEEQDQLPLLQHTLRRLWEQAPGEPRTMREEDYVTVGRIAGSIDKKAEAVVAALSKANSSDVATLECVMKALTDLDERKRATRRPQKRSELLAVVSERMATVPGATASVSLDRVLASFRAEDTSFLRIGDGDDPGVDIGHEALIRSWIRLSGLRRDFSSGWLREERNDGDWWRDYVRRAAEGAVLGSGELGTLSGRVSRREFGKVWSARYGDRWAEVEALRQRSADKHRQQRTVRAAVVGILAILVAFGLWTGYTVYLQRVEASHQATIVAQQTSIASENFHLSVGSAQKLLDKLSASVDRGDIPIKGATDMLQVAGEIVSQVHDVQHTQQTIGLLIGLAFTASDINATLGDYGQASESAKKARDLAEQLRATTPDDPVVLHFLYGSMWRMGDAISMQGGDQPTQVRALTEYQEAEKLAGRLVALAPVDRARQRDLMFVQQKIGDVYQALGKPEAASDEYDKAFRLIQTVLATTPDDRAWRQNLANTERRMGQAFAARQDIDSALAQFRAALDIRTGLAKGAESNDVVQSNLATSHRDMASIFEQREELDAALGEYRLAIEIQGRLVAKDPGNATSQFPLASSYAGMGALLRRLGNSRAALEQYLMAYGLRQALARKDPSNPGRQNSLAMTGISVADLLGAQKPNVDEALKLYRDAIAILDEVRPRYDNNVFDCYIKIGDILMSQNDWEGALKDYKVASAIARDAAAKNAGSVPWQRNMATSYTKIGDLLAAQIASSQAYNLAAQAPSSVAHDQYRQALDIANALAEKYPESHEWPALAESLKTKIQNLKL
jgi:tetratricopeptide (TPR) repeat protein